MVRVQGERERRGEKKEKKILKHFETVMTGFAQLKNVIKTLYFSITSKCAK
jgi:hypothetical protein